MRKTTPAAFVRSRLQNSSISRAGFSVVSILARIRGAINQNPQYTILPHTHYNVLNKNCSGYA
jgi:hypothetical protein